jgi:haloacetate dehalogenase
MFNNFVANYYEVNNTAIYALTNKADAGNKPPLLLLHGYPQSHFIWHKVVPLLISNFTLVLSDLRGYGQSQKPLGFIDHSNYSKATMAADQVALMHALGYNSFFVAGHDRGGRVAHRMALDYPEKIKKLCVLDISPTLMMYQQTNKQFAEKYWWWFFLIQPTPFPERLITAAPEDFLKKKIGYGSAGLSPFTEEAYKAYLSYVSDYRTNHGMCEDYRAAATIDLVLDQQSINQNRKILCPLHVLWGKNGVVHECFHPLEDWRLCVHEKCSVSGEATPSGHYLPEEIPTIVAQHFIHFFQ